MGIKTVPQPPYSPDLAPCYFWLFPKLKGCRYETIEEMKEAVTNVIATLTQEDFHVALQKLLERYNKCIAAGGYYFEGIRVSCVYYQQKCSYEKGLETYLMILVYIYIYIYIYIFKSCWLHGIPWLSLSICLHCSSLLAGPLDYIQCPNRAYACVHLLLGLHWYLCVEVHCRTLLKTSSLLLLLSALYCWDGLWDGR